MTRAIFAAVVTLAVAFFALQPAKAYEAPWCAVSKEGDHWDCHYRSIEECRPNVLTGNRGWCNPNPYFVASPTENRRSEKRRVRQQ
jgi:Protein of unknown function (DUF3551)